MSWFWILLSSHSSPFSFLLCWFSFTWLFYVFFASSFPLLFPSNFDSFLTIIWGAMESEWAHIYRSSNIQKQWNRCNLDVPIWFRFLVAKCMLMDGFDATYRSSKTKLLVPHFCCSLHQQQTIDNIISN